MTNYDKFHDIIEKYYKETNKPKNCVICKLYNNLEDEMSKGCPFNGSSCPSNMRKSMIWLFEDFKPRELKNGDNLKSGEVILCRNSNNENWKQCKYIGYYDGRFYCVPFISEIIDPLAFPYKIVTKDIEF